MFRAFILFFIFLCLLGCAKQFQTTDLKEAAQDNLELGLGYLEEGQRDRAKEKLNLALEQNPHSGRIQAAMGYYYLEQEDVQIAAPYYQRALSLAPHDGIVLNHYGVFLCRNGHYKESIQYFLKAVNDPNYQQTAVAYHNAGLCALRLPNDKEANIFFQKANEL